MALTTKAIGNKPKAEEEATGETRLDFEGKGYWYVFPKKEEIKEIVKKKISTRRKK